MLLTKLRTIKQFICHIRLYYESDKWGVLLLSSIDLNVKNCNDLNKRPNYFVEITTE